MGIKGEISIEKNGKAKLVLWRRKCCKGAKRAANENEKTKERTADRVNHKEVSSQGSGKCGI